MIDYWLQFGISNLILTLLLAVVAWTIHRFTNRPQVAHFLWLVVLVKLVIPPMVTIPMVPIPRVSAETTALLADIDDIINIPTTAESIPFAAQTSRESTSSFAPTTSPMTGEAKSLAIAPTLVEMTKQSILFFWFAGSLTIFVWSCIRIVRFHLLLQSASHIAPSDIQGIASACSEQLGIRKTPTIFVTTAHLSPMVWWVGGRIRIILPEALLTELDRNELGLVLAHELAHVRRCDHLVRWIEWLTCVLFWWNPVAWWARRNLRINEEICCDALVLESMNPQPHTYANALFHVIEFLASPAIRPPAVASRINSGGFLERRFTMIVSHTPTKLKMPRWIIASALLVTTGLLPFGVAYAQDYDAIGRRLREAVAAGELSGEQARMMMSALKKELPAKEKANKSKQISRADYPAIEAKIKNAIQKGELTEEEGIKKLHAVREQIAANTNHQRQREVRSQYAEAESKLQKMVESGRISEADMKARLGGMRKAIADKNEHAQKAEHDVDWDRIKERIEGAVKSGKMTREEADKTYVGIRKRMEMAREGEKEQHKPKFSKQNYIEAEAKMKKMVEAGRISEKDMKIRLGEMREAMAVKSEHAQKTERDVDWDSIKEKIEGAVKAGKMTREEADKTYIGIRKRMEMAREGEKSQHKSQFTKQDYIEAEAKMKKMLEAGKISEKDMKIRLGEMRRAIESGKEHARDAEHEIDWESIKKKVEHAVETGEMTREEADEIYRSIKERITDAGKKKEHDSKRPKKRDR